MKHFFGSLFSKKDKLHGRLPNPRHKQNDCLHLAEDLYCREVSEFTDVKICTACYKVLSYPANQNFNQN